MPRCLIWLEAGEAKEHLWCEVSRWRSQGREEVGGVFRKNDMAKVGDADAAGQESSSMSSY